MLFHNKYEEKILTRTDDGEYNIIKVHRKKMALRQRLQSVMNNLIETNEYTVNFGDNTVNVYDEILNLVTLLCNFISSQKVEKVLFVGHFESSNTRWTTGKHSHVRTDVVDMNVLSQFIPIILKEYNYNIDVSVVKPLQSRHNGLITDLYEEFGINIIRSTWQYEHGMNLTELRNVTPTNDFDCAVFAGVKMRENCQSFQLSQVTDCFGRLLTDDCKIIDMNKDSHKELRFLHDHNNRYGHLGGVNEVFETRKAWDKDVYLERNQEVNQKLYDFLDDFISMHTLEVS